MRPRFTWLLGDTADARRLRDTNRDITRARIVATVALLAVVPVFASEFGPWVVPVAVAYVLYTRLVDHQYATAKHPEAWMYSATIVTQVMFCTGAIASGGPDSPVLAWLLLAIFVAPTRYSLVGVLVVFAISVVGLAVVALSSGVAAFLAAPELTLVTLSTMVGGTAFGVAARQGELAQRLAATTDPLTGLHNRATLVQHFDDVRAEAAGRGELITLVVCDLDHFKQVNDTHGHAVGDAVIRDTAEALRRAAPPGARLHRLGGEEFAVMVTAERPSDAAALGDLTRACIAAARPGGIAVTASVGIGHAAAGGASFDRLFSVADGALYEAKRLGRNRSVTSPDPMNLRLVDTAAALR